MTSTLPATNGMKNVPMHAVIALSEICHGNAMSVMNMLIEMSMDGVYVLNTTLELTVTIGAVLVIHLVKFVQDGEKLVQVVNLTQTILVLVSVT
jgi:hypothetical protein